MKLSNDAGFTIIETMLFLGITGLLVMGVLVGTGTSINIQRYRDSVSSLQSVLQQQFSDVSNVNNDRTSDWACSGTAIPVQTPVGGGIARGQSDCVILGRYISTSDSHILTIKSVVGYIPSSSSVGLNDVDALALYKVHISPVTTETYEVEWGSSIVKPGGDVGMIFSILVLRSPSSGIIRTFNSIDKVVADNDIASLVNQTALQTSAKMCVNSNGLFTTARTAVEVTANATSASGVEVLGEATSGC